MTPEVNTELSISTVARLKKDLESADEIELTVIGRKSGRKIPRPVWFVLDGDKLLLLSGSGRKSEWYKNVLKNPAVEISVSKHSYKFRAKMASNQRVKEIVDKFREKYGEGDLKAYYKGFDAAVEIPLES
jgi:deazaflavin-dependent oxidoreductase (nitroreductase family)